MSEDLPLRSRFLFRQTTTAALRLAQRSVMLMVGLAIILGMLALQPDEDEHEGAKSVGHAYYDVKQESYLLSASIRDPSLSGLAELALREPSSGQDVFRSGYYQRTGATHFVDRNGPVWTHVRAWDDGVVILSIVDPKDLTEFDLRRDQSGRVVVTSRDASRTVRSRVAFSRDGCPELIPAGASEIPDQVPLGRVNDEPATVDLSDR